jgi:pimeloyl-ACP methyl ester carboxylesterase
LKLKYLTVTKIFHFLHFLGLDNSERRSAYVEATKKMPLKQLSVVTCMEIIRQEPDRVTRLALMDTNPLVDPPEKAAQRKSQINRVMAGALRSVMRDEIKPNYLCQASKSHDILNICMDMAQDLGPEVFQDQSSALQNRPDQCNTLQSVNVPSLILCGENDQLCPVSRHILMHDLISGSRLEIIPRAGHLPTLEQPELTNRKLEEWLKQ